MIKKLIGVFTMLYGRNNIERFINDLETKNIEDIQKEEYYSIDLDNKDIIFDDYGMFYIPLSNLLSDLKFDKDKTVKYYKYLLDNDYDDTGYNLNKYMNNYLGLSDEYIMFTNKEIRNTYNYDSNLECVIQFTVGFIEDECYIGLEVQNGGDVRGNYSSSIIYKYNGDSDYIFDMIESCYIWVNDIGFDISGTDVIQGESGSYLCDVYKFQECLETLSKLDNVNIGGSVFEY